MKMIAKRYWIRGAGFFSYDPSFSADFIYMDVYCVKKAEIAIVVIAKSIFGVIINLASFAIPSVQSTPDNDNNIQTFEG
jgi:hypothetical protein